MKAREGFSSATAEESCDNSSSHFTDGVIEVAAEQKFDVIIVGGGPAGASAAIRLAADGARVLVVEQKKFPREKLCGEFISPECFRHFTRLGVADEIKSAGGARLFETKFYAESGRAARVPSGWFGGGTLSEASALGLSRAEMDARLLARARAAGAFVLEDARAAGVVLDKGRVSGVRVQWSGRERVFESFVTIDATGRARALTRRLERGSDGPGDGPGGRARRRRLVAFKAHLEGACVAEGACEIYFYKGGYGGLSSVERGLSNLCFIVSARDTRACAGDAERMMREVVAANRRASETLKEARPVSTWLAVALEGFGRFCVAPAPGLLAIGDAASFIDPFTGSGMLMALEGGELAATVIARALAIKDTGGLCDATLAALAANYRVLYGERFDARLRVCAQLRRAAFAPRALTELGVALLGASARARRTIARATRSARPSD